MTTDSAQPPVEADLADLSPALQRDLRAVAARDDASVRLDRARSLLPVIGAVLGAAGAAWIAAQVVGGAGTLAGWRACGAWPAETRTQVLALAALASALLIPSLVALVRRRAAPLGSFWAVTPPYLVDVEDRRVRLYPLGRLVAVRDPPDQTLRLRLSDATLDIDLRPRGGRAFAEAVARAVAEAKACEPEPRAGYRDDAGPRAPGVLSVAEGKGRAPGSRSVARRWLGAVAGPAVLGAILGATLLPFARDLHGQRCLRTACAEAGSLAACQGYVARFPGGRHLDAIDDGYFRLARPRLPDLDAYAIAFPRGRHIEEIVPARRALFAAALSAPSKRHPMIDGALKALAEVRVGGEVGSTLHVRFSHDVERRRLTREDIQRLEERATQGSSVLETVTALAAAVQQKEPIEVLFPEDRMDPPSSSAFPDDAARTQEEQLAADLERALPQGMGTLGLRVKRLEGAAPEGAVVLDVHYQVTQRRGLIGVPRDTLSGEKRTRPISFWELAFRFTVSVAGAGGEPVVVEAYPPSDFSCVAQKDLYVAQRRAAFRLLAERLEGLFGLKVEPNQGCPRAREVP